jgi:hypothetical protein
MTTTVARTSRGATALATAMWAFYICGWIATLALRVAAHVAAWDSLMIAFTAFATVGWLVAVKSPRTPIGWLFLGIGVMTALGVVTDGVVQLALSRGWSCTGFVMFSAWVQLWFWYSLLVMSTAMTMLLFPAGLPSRRWRPVLVLLVAAALMMTVMAALSPEVDFGKAKLPNPIGVASNVKKAEDTAVFQVAGVILGLCIVASLVSLAVRFRRSSGIERAQLKWFFLGASALGVNILLDVFIPTLGNSWVGGAIFPITLACLPLSCGLAILRYRLYDIDRIVSRAVSYAVVTGLLVGGYVGCVALTTTLLSVGNGVGVAASTLAAAAAFQPLRRWVQRRVDRRFDRAAYDARRTVERFSAALRDEVDVDAVRDDLLTTVSLSVAPSSVSVWLVRA